MSAERRIEVKLRIVRTLAAQAKWPDAATHLQDLADEIELVKDEPRALELRFETLNWQLKAASRHNDYRSAAEVTARIRGLHSHALSKGAISKTANITALCSSAAYEIFYHSVEEGLRILEDCNPAVFPVPEELRHRAWLLRGLANLRLARWDEAEYESGRALAVAREENDVLQLASALTNLACSAIERGDWPEAERLNRRTMALHQALQVALDATLPIRLNTANLSFYQGRAADALNLYSQTLAVARKHSLAEFHAELEACVGLTALQTGETALVEQSTRTLQEWKEDELRGVQERFKIEWFLGYIRRDWTAREVWERLERVAVEQQRIDKLNCLKLRWLQHLLVPTLSAELAGRDIGAVHSDLRSVGLGWFVSFTRRWLRIADSRRASRPR
jgi:tetratricopeptide (TPR) repeat protein